VEYRPWSVSRVTPRGYPFRLLAVGVLWCRWQRFLSAAPVHTAERLDDMGMVGDLSQSTRAGAEPEENTKSHVAALAASTTSAKTVVMKAGL
jgi:hypothetical protein